MPTPGSLRWTSPPAGHRPLDVLGLSAVAPRRYDAAPRHAVGHGGAVVAPHQVQAQVDPAAAPAEVSTRPSSTNRTSASTRTRGKASLLPAGERVVPAAAARGLRAGFMLVEPDQAGLAALTALVAEGRLRPHVEHVLPLEQAAKAHELGEAGGLQGKIVLKS